MNESEITNKPDVNLYEKTTGPLSRGLLDLYQPQLMQTKAHLKELTDKQDELFLQIHNDNLSLANSRNSSDLQDMFKVIETYQAKLVTIKKDMKQLHEKSTKLKKRALKIQQAKEKQDNLKRQKEIELQMEQDLIPKHN